jgi:hypothetical protein
MKSLLPLSLVVIVLVAMAGCETPPPPFVPKASSPPPVVYCNDITGHKAGNQPWIVGGKCCCTPSDKLMATLQKDGFCAGMSAAELRAMYEKKGIVLEGPGHEQCNGLCKGGPHVVLGGKCMAPPVAGTAYFEKVVFGQGAVANPFAPKAK